MEKRNFPMTIALSTLHTNLILKHVHAWFEFCMFTTGTLPKCIC